MKPMSVILKRGLMVWGAISLIGTVAVFASVAYQVGTSGTRSVEREDPDVRYVVEWFGDNAEQDYRVEHSFNPAGSWAGDYMKVFAISMPGIDAAALSEIYGVIRGDKLTPILGNAVRFATDLVGQNSLTWFPRREQIMSSEYFVFPARMNIVGMYPDSVNIMLIRPADNKVYFVAVKT